MFLFLSGISSKIITCLSLQLCTTDTSLPPKSTVWSESESKPPLQLLQVLYKFLQELPTFLFSLLLSTSPTLYFRYSPLWFTKFDYLWVLAVTFAAITFYHPFDPPIYSWLILTSFVIFWNLIIRMTLRILVLTRLTSISQPFVISTSFLETDCLFGILIQKWKLNIFHTFYETSHYKCSMYVLFLLSNSYIMCLGV